MLHFWVSQKNELHPAISGWSMGELMELILADVDWTKLARKVRIETKNREVYQPLISVYRWWARRPHSLMGALIDAASCRIPKGACIADPFSGGGTVAIEAARRG